MFPRKTRTYMWEDGASRENKGLWLLVLISILLATVLILMFIARDQSTYVSLQMTPTATALVEGDSSPIQHNARYRVHDGRWL